MPKKEPFPDEESDARAYAIAWTVEDALEDLACCLKKQGISLETLAERLHVTEFHVRSVFASGDVQLSTLSEYAHAIGLHARVVYEKPPEKTDD